MVDEKGGFIFKAREALASAESDLEAKRFNSAANRAYYACFFVAIAALIDAGVRPEVLWGHDYVQAQFAGLLIHRRKLYPSELRDTLPDNQEMRQRADYDAVSISERQAKRAVDRARVFVQVVFAKIGGGR